MGEGVLMKLAEALSLRADYQKRIAQLKDRLLINSKVQEGDVPSEDPVELLDELNQDCAELEKLIKQINKTNSFTLVDNNSISDMIAQKDVLALKISILRGFVKQSAERIDRYSNKEIKIFSTINISEKQKEIDALSKQLRELDAKLQGINWTTEIME